MGLFWNDGWAGTWLGEIGGELFHDQHGQVVEDVEDQIAQYITELIGSKVEERSGCDDFARILQAIDEELDQLNICELWHHELAPLMERVINGVRASP